MRSFLPKEKIEPMSAPIDTAQTSKQSAAEPEKSSPTYALAVPAIRPVDLDKVKISQDVLALIPEHMAAANKMLPLYLSNHGSTLAVAMADCRNDDAINNIGVFTGLRIEPFSAPADKIADKIRTFYTTQRAYTAAKELSAEPQLQTMEDHENDESVPIIRFVNNMIEQAVQMKASDIHIEPQETLLRIRFRIDGRLQNYMDTDLSLAPAVASRIKFIAGLNIAERRIPQSGRIKYSCGNENTVDLRVSVLPSAFGEAVAIRITTALSLKLDKQDIGFSPENLALFERILGLSHGLVLLTGPTGSGKTTTLYTALSEINTPDIHIITIEDPVEMIMDNMTQIEVNPKTGLTFAEVMRSILRQDPDVVMVGEIRDGETAKIATTLSITGHLVFSTLHTFDSASAVMRLVDMGVDPYMVYSALSAVISQRLVRKLCPHCRHEYQATAAEKQQLGVDSESELTLYQAQGCDECHYTGYIGRTAVHEVLMMSPAIRDELSGGGNTETVRKLAKREGMTPLLDNLRRLVIAGTTSMDELRRTYSETL